MKKNSSIIIGIVVGIVIVSIVGFYNYQGLEKNGPIEIGTGEDISEDPAISKKLDDIEKQAEKNYYKPLPREWITSGPFQVDRSEYRLGESIFIRMGGLEFDEKGQIAFLRPSNETHYEVYSTIPFDGSKKITFNTYFTPGLSSIRGICSSEDLSGEWRVVFRGTEYSNIKFEISEKLLPGSNFSPVC